MSDSAVCTNSVGTPLRKLFPASICDIMYSQIAFSKVTVLLGWRIQSRGRLQVNIDSITTLAQAEEMQRSYEAKVTTLKETAVRRDQEDIKRWEARRNLVQKIYSSAQAS